MHFLTLSRSNDAEFGHRFTNWNGMDPTRADFAEKMNADLSGPVQRNQDLSSIYLDNVPALFHSNEA